jgi:uncharacterized protein YggE
VSRAAAILFLFVAAVASAEAPPHTITVGGSANIFVKADRGQFTVGVSTRATTVPAALHANNEKTQRVIDALKAHGVAPNEIATANFSIEEPYENGRRVAGEYQVRNSVTVTRSDIASVSDLLQVAIDAGANQAWNVRFFLAEPGAVRDQALAAAYRDARTRAEKLAAAAGKTVGDLVALTTEQMPALPRVGGVGMEAMTVTASAPPMEAGMQMVVANVVAQFELK